MYQIGTLVTEGSFGAGFVPGLLAVAAMVVVVLALIRKADRQLAAEHAMGRGKVSHRTAV